MNDVKVLIIGTDINAYYMARCYHELTGKKVDLIGKFRMSFTEISSITNVVVYDDLWDNDVFVKVLVDYAKKKKYKKKILLIATNDTYVMLVSKNRDVLSKYYLFNYPSIDIVNSLLLKEVFYEKYKDMGLDMPKTYIYKCNRDSNFLSKIKKIFKEYPLIIKPSDGVEYHKLDVVLDKVYKVYNDKELCETINTIEKALYKGNLIIQEFIPGGDSLLFDSIFYVNKDKKAEIASFAQIGLQERTPTGIGNCTVLVNGYSQFGYDDELINKLKKFLEDIGYSGFAEFDMKYDVRDGKYKVLEINPRQSRSAYYVSACGYNLVEYLIDDLYYNKKKEFEIIKKEYVLSFVPLSVIKKYVDNDDLKKVIFRLRKEKKFVNPLWYKKDMGLWRYFYLKNRDFKYLDKYKKYKF